jgi:hypothetical protein
MTTAVQVSQDFQTRLFEKIKTDIGSLMTDEELKKLVESAVERIWFTPEIKRDNYGREDRRDPPRLQQVVTEALGPKVKEAVSEYLAAHPDVVRQELEKALQGGMSGAIIKCFDMMFQQTWWQLQNNLQETLRNALQK